MLFFLELGEHFIIVIDVQHRVVCVIFFIIYVVVVGLVIVVTTLQPAILVQTLTVEEDKAEDCPIVRLINLLRDMPEVQSKDLIASELILLLLGHLKDKMAESLVLLQVLTNLLLNLCGQLVFFLLILHVLIFFTLDVVLLIVIPFILLGLCVYCIWRFLLDWGGCDCLGDGCCGESWAEVRIVREDLLCAEDVATSSHHISVRGEDRACGAHIAGSCSRR